MESTTSGREKKVKKRGLAVPPVVTAVEQSSILDDGNEKLARVTIWPQGQARGHFIVSNS